MIKKILKYLMLSVIALIVISCIWLLVPNSNSDFNDAPRKSTQYWELKTGSKIAYTHIKSKTDSIKSTLVYLHGGPGGYIDDSTINVFEEISKKGYDIYLYDQIGCGLSERLKNPKEYTVQRHSDDLNEILKTINSKNTTLIGQSWGGFLASYFAAYHPKSINQLILTSPGGIKPADSLLTEKYEPNLIKGLTNIDNRIDRINEKIETSMTLKEKLRVAIGSITANSTLISDHKVDGAFHNISKTFVTGMVCDPSKASPPTGRPGMYCSMFTSKSYKNIPADIRTKIKIFKEPVLILKAQCDYLPWQEAYEYKELFPFAELKVIKNAGHSIYAENKTDYISEILSFLEKGE